MTLQEAIALTCALREPASEQAATTLCALDEDRERSLAAHELRGQSAGEGASACAATGSSEAILMRVARYTTGRVGSVPPRHTVMKERISAHRPMRGKTTTSRSPSVIARR